MAEPIGQDDKQAISDLITRLESEGRADDRDLVARLANTSLGEDWSGDGAGASGDPPAT